MLLPPLCVFVTLAAASSSVEAMYSVSMLCSFVQLVIFCLIFLVPSVVAMHPCFCGCAFVLCVFFSVSVKLVILPDSHVKCAG